MATLDPPVKGQLPKSPGVKIIRAGQENAWLDGFEFLKSSKQAYEAERNRGYTEGLEAGKQEAARLLLDTTSRVDGYLASIEKDLSALALLIVKRVLEDFDRDELVARAAASALKSLRAAKAVCIKIHPSVEQRFQEHLAQLLARSGEQHPALLVETDSQLTPETCILSTDYAVVEATIDTQLVAIAAAMGLSDQKTWS